MNKFRGAGRPFFDARGERKSPGGLAWIAIVSLALLFSGGIAAQGGDAQYIRGTIDGEAQEWVINQTPAQSSAVFSTLLPGVHSFSISGYADDRFSREGSLSIDFTLRDEQPRDPEVLYFPFKPLHPRFSFGGDHGTGELIIESVDIDTAGARIKGRYQGELYYHQSPNTQPISRRIVEAEIEFNLISVRQ